jgi:hypothetical protein
MRIASLSVFFTGMGNSVLRVDWDLWNILISGEITGDLEEQEVEHWSN